MEELLIKELSKKKIDENICQYYNKLLLYNPKKSERNILKIVIIFRQLDQFKKLLKSNKIDDQSLRLISNNCDIVEVKKFSYVFKKDDIADNFYCIIRGKVSIINGKGEEVVKLQSGDYFGDWGLLDKKKRTASVYALEDLVMFALSPKSFQNTIYRCIKIAELERRDFIEKSFPPLFTIYNFTEIYKGIIKIMLPKNSVLYNEGDIADNIYLVYEGGLKIRKKTSRPRTIIKIYRGDFAGLETVYNFGSKNSEPVKYQDTLITIEDFNVIFKFNSQLIEKEFKGEIKNFLMRLLETKTVILKDCMEKHKQMSNNLKLTYREDIMKTIVNEDYKKDIDNVLESMPKTSRNHSQQKSPHFLNQSRSIPLIKINPKLNKTQSRMKYIKNKFIFASTKSEFSKEKKEHVRVLFDEKSNRSNLRQSTNVNLTTTVFSNTNINTLVNHSVRSVSELKRRVNSDNLSALITDRRKKSKNRRAIISQFIKTTIKSFPYYPEKTKSQKFFLSYNSGNIRLPLVTQIINTKLQSLNEKY